MADTKNSSKAIFVGPQRTASSWLDKALRAHPQIVLPTNVKETLFFDRHFDKGWNWYLSHFEQKPDDALWTEVGSTYFESPEARERIKNCTPYSKIIITVRNPIARTFSSFLHEFAKGRAPEDFFDAVTAHPRIVDSGRYCKIAPEWETTFGEGNVLYVVQEDIEIDPQSQLNAIFDFLNIKRMDLPEELHSRYGVGTVPCFQWLAALASRTASTLRKAGFHKVVEISKLLGLKRVYTGGNRKNMSMTRPILDYLLSEHEADISFLEKRLNRTFPHWREPSSYGLEQR